MPVDHNVDTDSRLIFAIVNGNITLDELLGHLASLENDPRIEPGYSRLLDRRGVIGQALTDDEEERLAAAAAETGRRLGISRTAIVMPADFGPQSNWIRLASQHFGDDNLRHFNHIRDALKWLKTICRPDTPQTSESAPTSG